MQIDVFICEINREISAYYLTENVETGVKIFRKIPKINEVRARSALAKLIEDPHRNDFDAARSQGQRGFRLRSGNWRYF